MQVQYLNGVHLPDSDLWLDPHHTRSMAVVSHAHSDHMKKHGHIVTTAATAAMMKVRGATKSHFSEVAFGQTLDMGEAQVTLYPAGHVLGSAQVLVEHAGTRLLYSGDFKLRPGRSSEPVEVPRADIVIMETTFGRPPYRFPENEAVLAQIRDFCWDTVRDGCAPVLLCYSLGKGQEVLAGLDELGLPIYLHEKHYEMANLYRHFGVKLPEYKLYIPGTPLDGVLLCASGCRKGRWYIDMSAAHQLRTAYISGWALDSGSKWRFKTDAAFPLSDHADYDDLLQYVEQTGASQIYTMHGFAHEFAADLRARGHQAQALAV